MTNNDFQYARILQAAVAMPWAILPAKLAVIRDLLAIRASGQRLTDEEVAAAMGNRDCHGALRFCRMDACSSPKKWVRSGW
jgi:hypothetical protein